ncbi:MAG: hypothetical protein WDW36_002851 [Sanguina aurantia]
MTAAAEVQAAAAVAAAAGESNAAAIEIDCGEASSVPESLLVQGRQDVAEAAVRSGAQLLDQSAHLVGCQSREDGRALKLLNMVQCLNALMERAVCREMPLFGWIEGTLFTGIADELRLLRCSLCKLKFLRVLEFKTRQGGLQGRGSASTPAEAPPGGAVGASPARAATAATAATAAAVAVDAAKDESTPRPVPPGQGASPSAAAHEPLTNPPIDRTHAQPGSTPLHTPDRKRERPMPAPPSLKPSPKPVFGPPGLTGRAALWPEAMQSAALQAMMYHSMVGSLVAAAACPRDAHTQGRRLLRVLQLSDVRVLSCDVQQHAVKVCGSKLSTLREVLERLYSTAAKLPAMSCMVQVNVEVLSHRWAQQTAASAIQVAAAASCNGPRRSGVQESWLAGPKARIPGFFVFRLGD